MFLYYHHLLYIDKPFCLDILYLFYLAFIYQVCPTEIKGLFYKGDLAKNSCNTEFQHHTHLSIRVRVRVSITMIRQNICIQTTWTQ